jgi:hypothetical protein
MPGEKRSVESIQPSIFILRNLEIVNENLIPSGSAESRTKKMKTIFSCRVAESKAHKSPRQARGFT